METIKLHTESKMYKEYLEDPLNLMEPDTFKSLSSPKFYSQVSEFIDPYLDYYFYSVKGSDHVGYGFRIIDKAFWDIYNEDKDKKVKIAKDSEDRWYIKIKR